MKILLQMLYYFNQCILPYEQFASIHKYMTSHSCNVVYLQHGVETNYVAVTLWSLCWHCLCSNLDKLISRYSTEIEIRCWSVGLSSFRKTCYFDSIRI